MPLPEFVGQTPRIESIDVGTRRRPLNQAAVDSLAESIAAIGLQSPITVKFDGGRFTLITGRHRLEACRKLGWERIPAFFTDMNERDSRLWEISENLHRAELTAGERADQIAEWVRLTTGEQEPGQLDPVSGGRGNTGGIRQAARDLPVSGATEEARRNTVRRAVRIASIAPEAREAAREAGLDDNQSALLRVAAAAPETQVEVVAEIVEARTSRRVTPTIELGSDEYTVEQPATRDEADTLFDLFLTMDPERQMEFYALIIGAFMSATAPKAEPQPRGAPERATEELLNVQRKLLETELVVALDTATKENPAWGLTRDGWTAVQMLLGIAAKNDTHSVEAAPEPVVEIESVEVIAAVEPVPEPELDRAAPWTHPLPADDEDDLSPGKLDVAVLVAPLLDTPTTGPDEVAGTAPVVVKPKVIKPKAIEFAVLKPAPKNKRSKIGEVRQATPEAIAALNAKLAEAA